MTISFRSVWLRFLGTTSCFPSTLRLAGPKSSRTSRLGQQSSWRTRKARKTALYLELASLRQYEKDAKKALQDKSLEVVELEARILPLRTRAVDLEDTVAELKGKVVSLEERDTQREILLGRVEGELAEKTESLAGAIESFRRTEEEPTNDVAAAYGEGFQDAIAQFACVHPKVDLALFGESKCIVDGQIVPRE